MKGFLSASLLVAVVGLGCDRIQQATKPNPQKPDYFAKKRECYELVEKRDRLDGSAWLLSSPHQCYVPSLNTCICEYVPKNGPPYVLDVLTGNTLASDVPLLSGESEEKSREHYMRDRDRLFSLCAE